MHYVAKKDKKDEDIFPADTQQCLSSGIVINHKSILLLMLREV